LRLRSIVPRRGSISRPRLLPPSRLWESSTAISAPARSIRCGPSRRSTEGGLPAASALGALSLILWLLIVTISIKYCLFVMRADNHGEGGILALMSLTGASWHGRGRALIVMGLFGA